MKREKEAKAQPVVSDEERIVELINHTVTETEWEKDVAKAINSEIIAPLNKEIVAKMNKQHAEETQVLFDQTIKPLQSRVQELESELQKVTKERDEDKAAIFQAGFNYAKYSLDQVDQDKGASDFIASCNRLSNPTT